MGSSPDVTAAVCVISAKKTFFSCMIAKGKLVSFVACVAVATLVTSFALLQHGAQCEQRLYLVQYLGVELPSFRCHRSRLIRKVLFVDLLQTRCRSVWMHVKIVRWNGATAARWETHMNLSSSMKVTKPSLSRSIIENLRTYCDERK